MTAARDQHTDNVILGSGEIFIDILNASGGLTGERYLGDAVGAAVTLATERTTIQSGTGQVAQDLVDVVRSVSRTIGFTIRDMSIDNWRAFIIGEDGKDSDRSVTVGAQAVADEAWGNIKRDRSIQLGANASNPSGVGAVGEPADAAAAGKTTIKVGNAALVQKDKWVLDQQSGRITFLADAEDVKVTYTPTAKTVSRAIAGTEAKQLVAAFRYIEDTASGKGRNLYARRCIIAPGGELALMSRSTEQQMAFTAAIQAPPSPWPALVIDDLPLTAAA